MPALGRACFAILVLGLTLTASACGERGEPTGPAAGLFPVTVVGDDERPLTLDAPARRIALLDPAFERSLEALGAGTRVVGTPLAANGELQAEKLRRLAPDLVVASAQTDERTLSEAAAATDAPIYIAQGSSVREVERTITHLGTLAAMPAEARAVVRGIERRRARVAHRVGGRARVSAFVDLGFFTAASDRTLAGDLLRLAGGRNVAGTTGGPLDLADLRRLDPDVYIVVNHSRTTLRELRQDRLARRLRAVREGHVAFLDSMAFDPGPGIGRTLEQLARALHPDAYR